MSPGRRIRWDKAVVVEALQRRRSEGLALNIGAIQKSDARLGKAIVTQFRSHDEALRGAGIDPASVRKQISWDKARIVAALQERDARGLAVNAGAIYQSDCRLGTAIQRHFDSHAAALRAAGIVPPVRQRRRLWDQCRIVVALRERFARGMGVNMGAIRKSDVRLAGAIPRYFRSHEEALRAAGIDPTLVVKRQVWDKPAIMECLRDRRARGLELNSGAIHDSDKGLAHAIVSHFGSHDEALRAIGADPETVRKQISWDRPKIVEVLRDRLARGLGVNAAAVSRSGSGLNGAISRHFGSHDEALRAAGFDPAAIRQRPVPLDRAAVIAALQERRAKGLELNSLAVRQSDTALASAIQCHFQSHDQALADAGIDPATARKTVWWDQAKILAGLRERAARGLDLHVLGIQKSDRNLRAAIERHFPSHDDALRAIGIDPASVRRRTHWDKARVIAALRDRQEKGLGLNVSAVASDPPLAGGIHTRFGSHAAALRAAGIDPDSVRKKRRPWQREEVLATLRGLAQNGAVPWPLAKWGDSASRTLPGDSSAPSKPPQGLPGWNTSVLPAAVGSSLAIGPRN
jgi:hypothetical protein